MMLKLCCELISWLCCVATSVSAYFRVLFSLIVRKTVSIVTDFKARHKEDRKKGFVSQINLWHNSHLFWHNSTSFLAQLTSFLAQLPYIVPWLTMIHNTYARRSEVEGGRCRSLFL